MLTNWTRDDARKLRDLLTQRLGGTLRAYHYETKSRDSAGTHTQNLETSEVKFSVSLQDEGKSERSFETTYETSTNPNARPVTVYAYCKRYGRTSGVQVYRPLPHCDNPVNGAERHVPDLLPATVEEWVDKVVATFVDVDAEFEPKQAADEAARKAEQERLAARPDLGDLVEEGKLTKVTLTGHSYDCGDKRSCGSLEVTADTDAGELKLTATLGSAGDLEDLTVTLNGQEANEDSLENFDPGTPHYYSGRRAVSEWEKNAEKTLQTALEEWLGVGGE